MESTETELQEIPPRTGTTGNQDWKRLETTARKVLVVEDDAAQREALADVLELWGYEPVLTGSAEEALFAVRHKRVDAALIDVFLPGRSGTAILSKLRAQFPEAVLVAMSALSDPAMARRCKGMGADLFVEKPVSTETLGEALSTQHQSWH